ncbi:MAG TPA: thioredoxin fold domain-containing protein, partial [Urbifossiella sp.]|nr:thioredoxin fold domain-containing protein [Urbifossiella sp.]
MSRAVLVAIAVAVVTSASPSQPPPPKDKVREKAWAPNLSQAILRSKEEKKPLAILFGADWAVAYTKLRGNFYDTPEFDRFVDKAVFVVGNPDKDDDVKARFSTFGVNGFPTLVVLDEKQAEIDRVTGRWEPEVYGGKLEALFRNVETYRKTGKTDFGEDAADKAHPHRLAAKLAAAGQAEVAKMVLDPKDRLTEDRLHALVLQTDARATLAPPRGKDAAREYGLEIKGSQFHGFAMSVGEQSIVLRRPLTSFGKADQVPP